LNKNIGASLYGGPILSDIEYRRQRYGETNVFSTHHLPNLSKGGLNLIFLPAESIKEIAIFFKELGESTGKYAIVKDAYGATKVINEGKFACVLAASYSTIGPDLSLLEMLKELGMRLFTMSGNRRNSYIEGCAEKNASGLSYAGVDLVGKLEDLGIIIDVSHVSDKGVEDIFDITTKAIVVASHSNSRKICENPRNLSDEQIKMIAERDGVIGLSMHPTLVSWENPDVTDVVKHIFHIQDLVGSDYVCIGTDYIDYMQDIFKYRIKINDPSGTLYMSKLHTYPKGLETVAKIGNLFLEMKKLGMDAELINKIKGENVLRVFKKTLY
jgi:membrane dipeptidase